MKDRERDILRKTILELLMKGYEHHTDLDKKVCTTGYSFSTTHTFRSQFKYLLNNGYIAKTARGIYRITQKGRKYFDALS